MAPINTETKIPDLLQRYVNALRVTLGLPNAATLPFVVGPTTEEIAYPRVVFLTSEVGYPHPRRANLTVMVELQTNAKQQDRPLEDQWTAKIRQALADAAGFKAWLAGLPEVDRTGYDVRKMRLVEAGTGMGVEDEKSLRGRMTAVAFHVRTSELQPLG